MNETRHAFFPSAPPPSIRELVETCRQSEAIQVLLEATDHQALLLDPGGRTLAASLAMLEVLDLDDAGPIAGQNPGQILNCRWATEGPGGCGATPHCAHCGICRSMQDCQARQAPSACESLLSLMTEGAGTLGEFRMRATPLNLACGPLIFLSLQSLSEQRRRESLEHFFFHQVLNLADGLEGTVRILAAEPESAPLLVRQLADFTQQLTQEIHGRRILIQAESGSLHVEHQDTALAEVMESLGAFFRNHDAAHKRHLEILPYGHEHFATDPVLLMRILVDLAMNAFEAIPIGGTVQVRYSREPQARSFSVLNPGVIPPENAARIFQRSFSTKAAGGRGLGTFGLRLLAERYLGGQLTFRTGEAEGTCFTLTLPAPEPMPSATESAVPATAQNHEEPTSMKEKLGTVLVVDDTKVIRHLVQSILAKDFHVLLAESGQEALQLCAEQPPDLVLLDVVMPEMDGYRVCRELKANPRTESIPIIFLTALSGKTYETQALEAGAIDFITKPINPDVVYARVRNHVEMKQAQDHLKDLSLHDSLTGIANRRAFDIAMDQEWRRGIRRQSPLSVIMGDVDFFKRYNDSLGHQQGDVCLQKVAQTFDSAVRRPSDTVARYGGEEFVCVLGDTDADGAWLVAEKIRANVEALALPHPDSDVGPCVTVSLGIATMTPDPRSGWLSLVEAADHRLYDAKRGGRNRVSA